MEIEKVYFRQFRANPRRFQKFHFKNLMAPLHGGTFSPECEKVNLIQR